MINHNIHHQPSPGAERNPEPARRTLQLLHAGTLLYGIFSDQIATVAKWLEPTPLPDAPKSVLGIVSVQGRMLTVLDLASLSFGDAGPSESIPSETDSTVTAARHLIALRGDEQLALAVDGLGGTVEIVDGDLDEKSETVGTLVVGVLHHQGLAVQLLNLKELFPTAIQGRERRRRRF